jgi:hypothetical protein
MILFANGCSFTCGTESTAVDQDYNLDVAWPRWLADHYGIKYINIAEPGKGNVQISRSTIDWITTKIDLEGYNPKDLLVTILWSGNERFETWNKDLDKHRSYHLTSELIQKTRCSPTDKLIKDYIIKSALLYSEEYLEYNSLYHMYITAKFLEFYGIEYYFASSYQTVPLATDFKGTGNLKDMYLRLYLKYLPRVNSHVGLHERNDTYWYYLKNIKRVRLSPYGLGLHYGEDGNRVWAERMITQIEHSRKFK